MLMFRSLACCTVLYCSVVGRVISCIGSPGGSPGVVLQLLYYFFAVRVVSFRVHRVLDPHLIIVIKQNNLDTLTI